MKVFVLGNGASLGCYGVPPTDLLGWGLEECRQLKDSERAEDRNLFNSLKNNYETVFQRLDEIRRKLVGQPQGLYWTLTNAQFEEYLEDGRNSTQLFNYMSQSGISNLVEEIYEKAWDNQSYTYLDVQQKRTTLIGPCSGNLVEVLEDLQFAIACQLSQYCPTPNLYDRFAHYLQSLKEPAFIINLCWDNLFEQAVRRIIKIEPRHLFPKDAFSCENIGSDILLSKPHGSIEYWGCTTEACSSIEGCFRITLVPGHNHESPRSAENLKCKFQCGNHKNLLPFIHPYCRLSRSYHAMPFVVMALESLRSALLHYHATKEWDGTITSIGYAFAEDSNGWVDNDLDSVFAHRKLELVSRDEVSAEELAKRVAGALGYECEASKVLGFDGYLQGQGF